MEQTGNGIMFIKNSTEPDENRFLIFPTRNKHSKDEVEKAKQWLSTHQKAVSTKTIWQKDENT